MENIKVDFSADTGKVKPMHAVNNGPVYKFTVDQRITNIDAFKEAEIPYARTHDAAFCSAYGGEHIVDILAIFPDFDKDATAPESYDFTLTDEYLKVMIYAGVKPFYRLGSKIEHWPKKYGTLPPKDFHKWAVICEHIIRHYTEGWADGFNYDIEYWEIWNEPDGAKDDADYVDKKCWGGTMTQFFEFYDIAAKHLKKCFPDKKIGGPATVYPITDWCKNFLTYLKEHNTFTGTFDALSEETAYILTVGKNALFTAEDYTIGFTTKGGIQLNNITFTPGEGNAVSINYDLTRFSGSGTAVVIAAVYDSDRVVQAVSDNVTFGSDGSGKDTLNVSKTESQTLKVFVWDSLNSLKALFPVHPMTSGN